MNHIGYDAAALGNHEFNYGIPLLRAFADQLDFPMLGANALDAATGQPAFAPYVIKPVKVKGEKPIRVGILGLTNPGIAIWDKANVEGQMTFPGLVEQARIWVPRMRAAGVDVVIVAAHSGATTSSSSGDALPYPENASTLVAMRTRRRWTSSTSFRRRRCARQSRALPRQRCRCSRSQRRSTATPRSPAVRSAFAMSPGSTRQPGLRRRSDRRRGKVRRGDQQLPSVRRWRVPGSHHRSGRPQRPGGDPSADHRLGHHPSGHRPVRVRDQRLEAGLQRPTGPDRRLGHLRPRTAPSPAWALVLPGRSSPGSSSDRACLTADTEGPGEQRSTVV